ncbi:hypothetical protein EGR_02142 [Echinococcus granulosus]|uniref:Uncharacterized protein n=1 Tax=Echinococcus granulosus TaxID=6210 RepID=W6UP75_ECHGR|nr:hypothetical protein EGR_02142 [Echinococcus granulosus]EUB63048.1 hypothetical protein EGR_02142 [Echinococcus granulosus]
MDTVSALNSSNSTSAKFDTSFAWFLAFMLVTVFLLFVLLTVICILAYFVYRLRRQSACLPSGLDADGDVIYGFSNKHAEFIECRSSVPASNASLTDPWNTRLGRSVEYCDCHLLHREEFERRRDNLLRRGVQFHTYPKVGVPVTHNGWMQRVLSQPAPLYLAGWAGLLGQANSPGTFSALNIYSAPVLCLLSSSGSLRTLQPYIIS